MSGPQLHPDVARLGFLVGSWIGEGAGVYPTIAPFTYGEEIRVSHIGKPFLAYTQRTWSIEDGRPLEVTAGDVAFYERMLLDTPAAVRAELALSPLCLVRLQRFW